MPSKYEILASVIKRENDQLEWEGRDGFGLWPLIHILGIIHTHDEGPRPGGPNNPVDWEQAVDEIYEQIATNYSIIDFDQPAPYDLPDAPTEEAKAEVAAAVVQRFETAQLDFGAGEPE